MVERARKTVADWAIIRIMIEIMIERWTDPLKPTNHVWSLWRDGSRLQIGNKHETPEAAEAEARTFCLQALGCEPDRISQL